MLEYPVRWITAELAVGYAPRSHDDLATIRSQGIGAIVNLCAECYDLYGIEKNAGFDVYHMPIPDEEAPALDDLERALAWVGDFINAGKKILVHCRFGIGRTGTFVAAYLMSKGYSLKTAILKMKHTPSAPMSRSQWDLLERYSEKMGVLKSEVADLKKKIEPEDRIRIADAMKSLSWSRLVDSLSKIYERLLKVKLSRKQNFN